MAKKKPQNREVETELAQVLVTPFYEDIARISVIDVWSARDSDVTTEILDEHLACADVTRDDWDRLAFLRGALTPEHRSQLEEALEHTQKAGVVELLAWTCANAKEFAASLKRGEAGEELQPAVDWALRRFANEPAIAKKLLKRGKPFAATAYETKWRTQAECAWRSLFVTDTKESAEVVAEMIDQTRMYTNHGVKERLLAASGKRARLLKHKKTCAKALRDASTFSWTKEELVHSLIAVDGKTALKGIVDSVRENIAIGAQLALQPASKAHHRTATKLLKAALKQKKDVGWYEVGAVNGIVMGIEAGKVKSLYKLLEDVAKWRFTGSPYDNHGKVRAELSGELLRRRARRVLDAA